VLRRLTGLASKRSVETASALFRPLSGLILIGDRDPIGQKSVSSTNFRAVAELLGSAAGASVPRFAHRKNEGKKKKRPSGLTADRALRRCARTGAMRLDCLGALWGAMRAALPRTGVSSGAANLSKTSITGVHALANESRGGLCRTLAVNSCPFFARIDVAR